MLRSLFTVLTSIPAANRRQTALFVALLQRFSQEMSSSDRALEQRIILQPLHPSIIRQTLNHQSSILHTMSHNLLDSFLLNADSISCGGLRGVGGPGIECRVSDTIHRVGVGFLHRRKGV